MTSPRSRHPWRPRFLLAAGLLALGQSPGTGVGGVAATPAPATISASLQALRAASPDGTAPVWVYFRDRGFTSPEAEQTAIAALVDPSAGRRLARRVRRSALDLPVCAAYLAAFTDRGLRVRQTSRWLNAASVELPLNQLAAVAALPGVARLEPVRRHVRPRPLPEELPLDHPRPERTEAQVGAARDMNLEMPATREPLTPMTSFPAEEALHYGATFNQNAQIGVIDMHRRGYTGAGVRVLILDSGFRTDHRSTAGRRLVGQRDFVFNDANVNNEPGDLASAWNHGTAVWSDLGGFDPGAMIGVSYEAEILLAKTEDIRSETPAEEDNFVAAIEWGESLGADVASASLLYLTFDGGAGYTYSQLNGDTGVTTIVCDIAASRGMAVVTANGNNGPVPGTLGTPADADSTISVGAVDSLGTIAGFSSRGPTADGRIKPEVVARGRNNYTATAGSNGYGPASGTSFATPLTGGVAALLLEAHPDWSGWQVRQALINTASHAGTPDNTSGYGLLSARLAADSAPKSPPRVSLPFALIAPARGVTVPSAAPQLRWERSLPGASGDVIQYQVRLATDPAFASVTTYNAGADSTWSPPWYLNPGQTYFWQVVASNQAGWTRQAYMSSRFTVSAIAGAPLADAFVAVPRLLAPQPNPFQPSTRLGVRLPAFAGMEAAGLSAPPRPWRLAVYNAAGRSCRQLRQASWGPTGLAEEVVWDGRDDAGQRLPGGVYFVQLVAGDLTSTTKVVLAR